MKHHVLKAQPEYYVAYISGDKNWSMRKNDRNFAAGDTIRFMEWDCGSTGAFSGPFVVQRVWEFPWLPAGHVMLSLDPLPLDYEVRDD